MRHLSEHYERSRRQHPDDELCIVFDIDGTILDLRHFVVHVLLAYDRSNSTDHFRGLVADDITHHEDDIDQLLQSLAVPRMFAATSPGSAERTCGIARPCWRRAGRTKGSSG